MWPFLTDSPSRLILIKVARFFALQHPYFYEKGTCNLCRSAQASLGHLLTSCAATSHIRLTWDLPADPRLLRIALLTMSPKGLYSLVDALLPLVGRGAEQVEAGLDSPPGSEGYPRVSGQNLVVRWDGSFGPNGAGVGLTV